MRLEFMPDVAAGGVADVGDCEAMVEVAIVDDRIPCRADDSGTCCWWGELHFCARPLFKDFKAPATATGASSNATVLAKTAGMTRLGNGRNHVLVPRSAIKTGCWLAYSRKF